APPRDAARTGRPPLARPASPIAGAPPPPAARERGSLTPHAAPVPMGGPPQGVSDPSIARRRPPPCPRTWVSDTPQRLRFHGQAASGGVRHLHSAAPTAPLRQNMGVCHPTATPVPWAGRLRAGRPPQSGASTAPA